MRADALHSWTRAVYNVSQHRLASAFAECLRRPADWPIGGQDVSSLIWMVLNAAIAVTEADSGNVQIVDNYGGLHIVAHRGFDRAFLDHFDTVHDGVAACGTAMQAGHRIIVSDVMQSSAFSASDRAIMRDASARAVQSTPVVSAAGSVIAMVSTHFQVPHKPSEKQLRLLDALVLHAGAVFTRAAHECRSDPGVPALLLAR